MRLRIDEWPQTGMIFHTRIHRTLSGPKCPYCGTRMSFAKWRNHNIKTQNFLIDDRIVRTTKKKKCMQCKKMYLLPVYKLITIKKGSLDGADKCVYVLREIHALMSKSLEIKLLFKGNKGILYDKLYEVNIWRLRKGRPPFTSTEEMEEAFKKERENL